MKRTLLFTLLMLSFYTVTAKSSCEKKIFHVDNLADLNQKIDFLVSNSSTFSTTIILGNGEYGNKDIHWSDSEEIGLWRDISPKGGCPCEIKAETNNNVTLFGKLLWRIRDARDLTIRGINFIKTRKFFAEGLVDISGNSENITISDCVFKEFKTHIPTITGDFFEDPDPTNDINYYIHAAGINNTIKSCVFETKYSNGTYVNMHQSTGNKILKCTFSEQGVLTEGEMRWYKNREFISLGNTKKSLVSNCDFYSKKTKGFYVNFYGGTDNVVTSSNFTENPEDYVDTLEEPLYGKFEANVAYVNFNKGQNNEAVNNFFGRKRIYGNYVDASVYDRNIVSGHLIKNNHFENLEHGEKYRASFIKLGSCGGDNPTSDVNTGIRVEGNLFKNYNLDQNPYYEVISNKSSGNFFVRNTFEDCNGGIRLRCGNSCTVENNRFIGIDRTNKYMDGVDINGKNHKVFNNYFENLTQYPITLNSGNLRAENKDFSYRPVENLEMTFNTFVNCDYNILIRKFPKQEAIIVPKNSKIENNIFHFNAENKKSFVLVYPNDAFVTSDLSRWDTNIINNNILYSEINKANVNINGFDTPFISNYYEDPMLTNDLGEYIPQDNSIVKNNATINDYIYVVKDINGRVRDSDRDIGCYEINSSTAKVSYKLEVNQLKVYPNPSSDHVNIMCADCGVFDVEILDALGNVYMNKQKLNVTEVKLNVSLLNRGLFFIKIRSEKISKTLTFVKQ